MFLKSKKRKNVKCITWMLVTAVLFCTATGCTEITHKEEISSQFTEPTLLVETITAETGATDVHVPIKVYNNPGVAGATIQIDFDEKLVLKEVLNGDVLDTMDFSMSNIDARPLKCSWDSVEGEVKKDGKLLVLVFNLPEAAQPGDVYNVDVTYRKGDVYNDNWADVNFTLISGGITVK